MREYRTIEEVLESLNESQTIRIEKSDRYGYFVIFYVDDKEIGSINQHEISQRILEEASNEQLLEFLKLKMKSKRRLGETVESNAKEILSILEGNRK